MHAMALAVVAAILALFPIRCLGYDDKEAHPKLTGAAAEASQVDGFLKTQLMLERGSDHRLPYENGIGGTPTVMNWLRYGAMKEDSPMCRSSNHFHNPLNSKSWADSFMSDEPAPVREYCDLGDYPFQSRTSAVTWATRHISPDPPRVWTTNDWERDDLGTYLGVSGTTDAAGEASFRLPAAAFRFTTVVQGSTYAGAALIAADLVNPVPLSTGGAVVGVAVDDGAGNPLGGLPVYVFSAAGAYLGIQDTTDAQGHVAFTLSDGTYRVRADLLGGQFWTEVFTVPAQTSALLAVPHGLAQVQVTEGAAPVAGAPVYLFSSGGAYLGVSAATDADGVATFSLPAGVAYAFRADAAGGQYWSGVVSVTPESPTVVGIAVGP